MKTILILFLFLFSQAFAQTALTEKFRLQEISAKVDEALKAQKKLEEDPNARAKVYAQKKVDNSPCPHCPAYMDLVDQVNKIVEKIKDDDVKNANDKLIALTKLKFLYYFVKSTNDNDETKCVMHSYILPFEEAEFKKGTMNLAAEEALTLHGITDVQFYEGPGKEVHYFYRGEAPSERNTVIEVVMNTDKTALVRYYKYDSGLQLPSLDYVDNKKQDHYIKLDPKIETTNQVVPADVKLGTIGNKITLTNDLNLKHQSDVSYNKQETNLSLEDEKGKKYLAIQGTNNTNGKKIIDTVVNYDFPIDSASELKLGASAGNTAEHSGKPLDSFNHKQVLKLGLTDHDHEYINVRTLMDVDGVATVGVGNKIKVLDGALGADAQFDRDGKKIYKVDMSNQGLINSAGVKYTTTLTGERTYGAVVGAQLDKNLKLNTEYSKSSLSGGSVAVNFEKRISETTSMVLSVSKNGQTGTNLMYQFQSRY